MTMVGYGDRDGRGQGGAWERGIAALVLASAIGALSGGPWALTVTSGGRCPYARETGRPCVGCGGTRAFADAARGQFGRAVGRNVLGAFAGAAAWLAAVGALGSLVTGRAAFLKVTAVLVVVSAPAAFVAGVVEWWLRSRPAAF